MKINNLLAVLFFLSIALFSACNEEENLLEVVPENQNTPENIQEKSDSIAVAQEKSDSLAIELESKVDFKNFSVGRNNTKVGVIGQYVYLHVGVSSVLDIEEIKVYVQKSETDETPITEAKSFKRDKETELIEEIPLDYDIAPGKYYLVVSVLDKNQKETKIGSEVELKHFMAYEVEVVSDVYALNNKRLIFNSESGMFSIDELLSSYPIKTAKVLIKKSDTQEWLAEKDITSSVVGKTELNELISGIKIDSEPLEDENWELKLDPYGPADMYLLLEDEKGNKETLLIAQITVIKALVEIGKVEISSTEEAKDKNNMKLFTESHGYISIDTIKNVSPGYYISRVEIAFFQEASTTVFNQEIYSTQMNDDKKLVLLTNFNKSFEVPVSTLGEYLPTLIIESKPFEVKTDEEPKNIESSFELKLVEVIAKP